MKKAFTIILFFLVPVYLMSQVSNSDAQKELQGLNTKVNKLQTSVTGTKSKLAGIQETNARLSKQADSLKTVILENSRLMQQAADSILAKSFLISLSDKRVNEISEALGKRKTYTITGGIVALVVFVIIAIFLINMRKRNNELTDKIENTTKSLDEFIDDQTKKLHHILLKQDEIEKEITNKMAAQKYDMVNLEQRIEQSTSTIHDVVTATSKKSEQGLTGLKSDFEKQLNESRQQIHGLKTQVESLIKAMDDIQKKV